jgi:hypothetical protein
MWGDLSAQEGASAAGAIDGLIDAFEPFAEQALAQDPEELGIARGFLEV